MKENILDVLMYLFEHFMDEDNQISHDQDSLKVELVAAGFQGTEVNKAFAWLEALSEQQIVEENFKQSTVSLRVYLSDECDKLDVECRGFLMFLEQANILDPQTRELVIDRVMELDTEEFTLDQLKWVVLMVLFNQPGQESSLAWMEDLVFDEVLQGKFH